jgi:hypothetical protein
MNECLVSVTKTIGRPKGQPTDVVRVRVTRLVGVKTVDKLSDDEYQQVMRFIRDMRAR